MTKIAIDLVPLRPGGVNGGAGVMIRYLLDHLSEMGDGLEFILLTAPWNHKEVSRYKGDGVILVQAYQDAAQENPQTDTSKVPNMSLLERIRHTLPWGVVQRILPAARWVKQRLARVQVKAQREQLSVENIPFQLSDADVLFCPFTAVTYAETGMYVISYVHDLQHRVYPQFFSDVEIQEREAYFAQMAERADLIMSNSSYTLQTLYEYFPETRRLPARITPVSIHKRFMNLKFSDDVLDRYELGRRPYLFYPANFWPHKNHNLLITAFGMYRARNPESDCCLVLTGALPEEALRLQFAVRKMGLEESVFFLAYLPEDELAAVFEHCAALIFPSLFEGFGIPLLEAFLFEKPVLCSSTTSLPEVGGAGAYYFDPRKPLDIVNAIEALFADPDFSARLAEGRREQLKKYAPEKMLEVYRTVFQAGAGGKNQS